ncbi:MAG: RNA methyltransferase [Bacteroidota bacterium]
MRKLSLKELNRISVAEFKATDKTPIVLVLDNIRSALNVGSAFRTADAFALAHIYLCGITAKPPHREILKTAIGATDSVDWTYCEQVEDAITDLKGQGYTILSIEQTTDSTPLQEMTKPSSPIALVFGNEVSGVSDTALNLSDRAIEIPQFGTKHSLNISVCLGIVVWSFFEKLKL